jgi:Zn-dependent protease
VSAAGPLSNLLLGSIVAILLGLLGRFSPEMVARGSGVLEFLQRMMIVNAALAIFNLLPIPPLDGSHVAGSLMPYRWRPAWDQFARLAPFLLLGLILFGRSLIWPPIRFVFGLLWSMAATIAG